MHTRLRALFPLTLVLAGLTLFAPISHAAPSAPPGGIAVIDLEKVFNSLHERTAKAAELNAYRESLSAEFERLKKEADDAKTKADPLPEGPDRKEAFTKIAELQINLRVKKDFYEALLDQRQSEMFKGIYDHIADASKRLAVANKYGMVIVSDESVKVPGGPSADTQRVISMKRLLYVSPEHDVTNDLITLMNNEYLAAGGKAPTPAPAPAPAATPPDGRPAAPAGTTPGKP